MSVCVCVSVCTKKSECECDEVVGGWVALRCAFCNAHPSVRIPKNMEVAFCQRGDLFRLFFSHRTSSFDVIERVIGDQCNVSEQKFAMS